MILDESTMDIIENNLYYGFYLAESEMDTRLALLDNKAKFVTEASQYQILNEGLLDTIRTYIEKIVSQLQVAFQKFIEFSKGRDMAEVKEMIAKNNGEYKIKINVDFTEIPNFDNFNAINRDIASTFNSVTFTTAEYKKWKEEGILNSEQDFIKAKYGSLISKLSSNTENDNMDIGTRLHNYIYGDTGKNKGYKIDGAAIEKYVDFINKYENEHKDIENLIKKANSEFSNVSNYLTQLEREQQPQQPQHASAYIGSDGIFDILQEGNKGKGGNKNPQSTPQKQSGTPSNNDNKGSITVDGQQQNNDQNNAQKNNVNEDRQYIINYIKANVHVLLALMKIHNQVRNTSCTIIKNYINLQSNQQGTSSNIKTDEEKEDKDKDDSTEQSSDSSKTKVDTKEAITKGETEAKKKVGAGRRFINWLTGKGKGSNGSESTDNEK